MGLAGRKEKQRIGPDPRNLTWAQDNSRFGQQYLAKFGWTPDSGSGLGANGDGRLSHIPIAQKLNLLGIGSGPGAGASSPDAIAWKQSRDFEAVLKRLNGVEPEQEARLEKALLYGFVRGETTEGTMGNDTSGPEVALDEKAERRKEKKEETRRRKHERAGGGREIVQDALQAPLSPRLTIQSSSSGVTPVSQPKTDGMGPRMAHRAKFRASKQLASLSSAALSEILGVSPSGSVTPASGTQSAPVPASEQPTPNDDAKLIGREDQLTVSATSVADYFAAKLKARRLETKGLSEPQSPLGLDPAEDEEKTSRERKREKKRKREREVERTESGDETRGVVDEVLTANAESDDPHKSRKKEARQDKKKKRRKDE